MELFTRHIEELRNYVDARRHKSWQGGCGREWPRAGRRKIVLADEVGVELGSPRLASASYILWTEHPDLVEDGRITLIGPDLPPSRGQSLPFGKVTLVSVKGFDEDNTYDRYRDLERIRYHLDLEGYMLRAAMQEQKEWTRISKQALQRGFSFDILGSALMKALKELDYVQSVEMLFVTSGSDDMIPLKEQGDHVARIVGAMNKMASDLVLDCSECEYQDVCEETSELRAMRKAYENKRETA